MHLHLGNQRCVQFGSSRDIVDAVKIFMGPPAHNWTLNAKECGYEDNNIGDGVSVFTFKIYICPCISLLHHILRINFMIFSL